MAAGIGGANPQARRERVPLNSSRLLRKYSLSFLLEAQVRTCPGPADLAQNNGASMILVRVWISSADNADLMIGEDGMASRQLYFGHVTACTFVVRNGTRFGCVDMRR